MVQARFFQSFSFWLFWFRNDWISLNSLTCWNNTFSGFGFLELHFLSFGPMVLNSSCTFLSTRELSGLKGSCTINNFVASQEGRIKISWDSYVLCWNTSSLRIRYIYYTTAHSTSSHQRASHFLMFFSNWVCTCGVFIFLRSMQTNQVSHF